MSEGMIRLIASILVGVIAAGTYIALRVATDRYARKRKAGGEKITMIRVSFNVIEFVVLLLGILGILQINGINITAIAAGLGIASAIFGLAVQDFLKDIITGFHIISDHFYMVGECVEFEGREAVILSVSLKTTKIGDLEDHSVTTICNRNITQIRRLSERLMLDIPLSYEEDPAAVHETLQSIAKQIGDLEQVRSCEYCGTHAFEASAIMYRFRIFCKPEMRAEVRHKALQTVQLALNEKGIRIPFNQLDVHIDGDPVSAEQKTATVV